MCKQFQNNNYFGMYFLHNYNIYYIHILLCTVLILYDIILVYKIIMCVPVNVCRILIHVTRRHTNYYDANNTLGGEANRLCLCKSEEGGTAPS